MYKNLVSKRLLELAEVVRRTFEKVAEKEKFPSDLCGLCARASIQLFRLATMEGIRADICVGNCHAFLIVPVEEDDRVLDVVLDVTATQFGCFDKVQVAPLPHMSRQNSAWSLRERCKTLDEFKITWGWEGDETYKRYARAVDGEMTGSQIEISCGA